MFLSNLALLGRRQVNILRQARYFSQELVSGWPDSIKNFLEREKIHKPTLIQEKTLPVALQNKNLVGIARTGSGKTLAFVIPAVMKVLKSRGASKGLSDDDDNDNDNDAMSSLRKLKNPTCLVLAPTRELATQTSAVFQKFRHLGLQTISLVGGTSRNDQLRQLQRSDPDVFVATPGRLMDLLETGAVDLNDIKYLVLDEADRMLDMGFEPQIRRIMKSIPKERQILMWSATWPQEIQSLANEFLEDYEYIAVDSENLKANPNIKQVIQFCEPHEKLSEMLNHLEQFKDECDTPRVLVFVNTKRLADSLLIQMMRNKIRAIAIHGDRSQNQRDHALRLFRDRMCHVLVATDVAARGLDISDITHVLNFDFPNSIEDYIHRIGRTARHDRKGTAVTFFTINDVNMASKLIKVLRETHQYVPDKLEELARDQHRYKSEARDFSRKRYSPRQDFFSGRNTNRFGNDRRDRYNRRQEYDLEDTPQERRRFRASNVFDD